MKLMLMGGDSDARDLKTGGEGGIRTLDTFPYTRFPGVLLQPLGHLTVLRRVTVSQGRGKYKLRRGYVCRGILFLAECQHVGRKRRVGLLAKKTRQWFGDDVVVCAAQRIDFQASTAQEIDAYHELLRCAALHDVAKNLFYALLMKPFVLAIGYEVGQQAGVIDRATPIVQRQAAPVGLRGDRAVGSK